MRLSTHVSTAIILAYLFDSYLAASDPGYRELYPLRASLYINAALLQYLIDGLGHTWVRVGGRAFPARNRLHSLPGVVILGLLVGLPIALAYSSPLIAVAHVSFLLLHWLEDLVTEGGVYIGKRRLRLPRFLRASYDSTLANRLAVVTTLCVVLRMVWPPPLEAPDQLLAFTILVLAAVYGILQA